ncbi:MAG: hypothetical protein LBI05_11780, partial [Planctomycetaceae bacterium]|nr:hypothetical protein [Planctomycetaceae bacterium]
MTNRNAESDNWGQLLSDFGIEDKNINNEIPDNVPPPERVSRPEKSKPAVEPELTGADNFGVGLVDFDRETTDESAKQKEKKSIFSRFPKMNFFGAPPEVSLDTVMEGVKSPSLGGKAFTDNKLEKMPLSHERTDRQQKNRQEPETPAAQDA